MALAASHEHYAAPVQGRIRHKRCPLRATPIYSVSTLSWLHSALKRLPSFALDSWFARDLAPGHQTQNLLPPSNQLRIQFVTAGVAENPLYHGRFEGKKVAGFFDILSVRRSPSLTPFGGTKKSVSELAIRLIGREGPARREAELSIFQLSRSATRLFSRSV
jgi:hypothetical protein